PIYPLIPCAGEWQSRYVPRGGTPRGFAYVPRGGTYGAPLPDLPYVPRCGTGCPTRWYGILFFATRPAGGIGEQLAVPFLVVPGWRVRAVGEIGEAGFCGDPAAVTPK